MVERTALSRPKREFNGQQYILNKIDYSEDAAKEDEAFHKQRGRKVKIVEEDGYWLVYTKMGQ